MAGKSFRLGLVALLGVGLSYYYPFVRRRLLDRNGRHPDSTPSKFRQIMRTFNEEWTGDFSRWWRLLRRPALAAFVVLEVVALVAWLVSL